MSVTEDAFQHAIDELVFAGKIKKVLDPEKNEYRYYRNESDLR